jgi:DNA-directed RNA polymerase specialized sigma24 family protein
VNRRRRGKPAAAWAAPHQKLEKAYEDLRRTLVRVARRSLGNWDGAEDALQDAAVAALEACPSANLPGWLISTVRNAARAERRRRRRPQWKLDTFDES